MRIKNMLKKSTIEKDLISGSLWRLRGSNSFLSALALCAQHIPSQSISQTSNDGLNIIYSAETLCELPRDQIDGLLLHHVLHMVLCHGVGQEDRDPHRWNAAADIVVNGIIAQQRGYRLLPSTRAPEIEHLPIEEIYKQLEGNDIVSTHSSVCFHEDPHGAKATRGQDLKTYWQQAASIARKLYGDGQPKSIETLLPEGELDIHTLEMLEGKIRDQRMDDIFDGKGEQHEAPLSHLERFIFIIGMSRQIENVERTIHAFTWLAKHVNLEWIQLFVKEILPLLDLRKLKGDFAVAVQQDPYLREVVQQGYALAMGGARR